MPWTDDQKLAYLIRLPWTVLVEDGDEPGERVLRIEELPSVIVGGVNARELAEEFWVSLRTSLETYLHYGDRVPVPPRVGPLPRDQPRPDTGRQIETRRVEVRSDGDASVHTEPLPPPPTALSGRPTEPLEPCTV